MATVYLNPSDLTRSGYRYEVTPVPEPATLMLLGTGLLGLLARRGASGGGRARLRSAGTLPRPWVQCSPGPLS